MQCYPDNDREDDDVVVRAEDVGEMSDRECVIIELVLLIFKVFNYNL